MECKPGFIIAKQEDEWMSYRIIGDSCTDLTKTLKENENIKLVPLTLIVDDVSIVDDETFDQQAFIKAVRECPRSPKSACPSPEDYMKHFDCDGDVYVVTISSQLSGSHNSAEVAKNIYLEDHPDKNIAVIDSRGASVSQTLITKKLIELIEEKHPFEEIVKKITTFREELNVKFVLESLETLRKNGRLTGLLYSECAEYQTCNGRHQGRNHL